MQKMINPLLIVLIGFLSACNTPTVRDMDQCLIKFESESYLETLPELIDNASCFCRSYRHSSEYIGPVTEFKKVELSKCNNMIGYNVIDYVDLNDYLERVRRLLQRRKPKKENKDESFNYLLIQ